MIAFEVWLNGKKLSVAGVGEYGVLSQILTWVASRPKDMLTDVTNQQPDSAVRLTVGGLVNDEHVRWLKYPFVVNTGDEITVKIIETDTINEPFQRSAKEDSALRLKKVQYQLNAAKDLLPSPATEEHYLASIKGFEEMMAKNEFKIAVEVLGTLGELNNCPPEFWKELLPAAVDLQMYEQATTYRKKVECEDTN